MSPAQIKLFTGPISWTRTSADKYLTIASVENPLLGLPRSDAKASECDLFIHFGLEAEQIAEVAFEAVAALRAAFG